MKLIKPSCLFLVGFLFVGCFSSGEADSSIDTDSNTKRITKAELGEEWPFTVDEGMVSCDGSAVTFTANGVKYPVNGVAKSILRTNVEDIWAYDEAVLENLKQIDASEEELRTAPRKSIAPIIEMGLDLCN